MAGVKKSSIRAEMSKKFKAAEDRIAVFGLKAKYGGGRSSCFVTVYDDLDARKKYDTKTNLARVSSRVSIRRERLLCLAFDRGKGDCLTSRFFSFQLVCLIFNNIFFIRTKS